MCMCFWQNFEWILFYCMVSRMSLGCQRSVDLLTREELDLIIALVWQYLTNGLRYSSSGWLLGDIAYNLYIHCKLFCNYLFLSFLRNIRTKIGIFRNFFTPWSIVVTWKTRLLMQKVMIKLLLATKQLLFGWWIKKCMTLCRQVLTLLQSLTGDWHCIKW